MDTVGCSGFRIGDGETAGKAKLQPFPGDGSMGPIRLSGLTRSNRQLGATMWVQAREEKVVEGINLCQRRYSRYPVDSTSPRQNKYS